MPQPYSRTRVRYAALCAPLHAACARGHSRIATGGSGGITPGGPFYFAELGIFLLCVDRFPRLSNRGPIGIGRKMFRHSYRSWWTKPRRHPRTTGTDASRSFQTTMNVCGRARADRNKQAHNTVAEMVLKAEFIESGEKTTSYHLIWSSMVLELRPEARKALAQQWGQTEQQTD